MKAGKPGALIQDKKELEDSIIKTVFVRLEGTGLACPCVKARDRRSWGKNISSECPRGPLSCLRV